MRTTLAFVLGAALLLSVASQDSVLWTKTYFTAESLKTVSDTQGWVVSGNKGGANYVSTCGANTLFGGFDKFGVGAKVVGTFSNLPVHKTLRITGKY